MVSFASHIFLSGDDTDKLLENLGEIGERNINIMLEVSAPAQRGVVRRALACGYANRT